jgi:hypothetical protein
VADDQTPNIERAMLSTVRRRVILTVIAASLLVGACGTSSTGLKNAAEGEPGVIRVRVEEAGGDHDIPFSRIPKFVTVWMDADASTEEVMAIFDGYGKDIDEGDVGSVDVILDGPKQATLSSGEGIHVTRPMVRELVAIQDDELIVEYGREAYPVLRSVYLTLAPTGFKEVVSVADRYQDAEDIDSVDVVSGDFVLIRDEVNEDLRITTAREELVRMVGSRFRLRGAVVSGRGPLELIVHPEDEVAVRRLVKRTGRRLAGKVIVATSRRDVS